MPLSIRPLCIALNLPANAFSAEKQTIIESGGLLHVVFFGLKKPNGEEGRKVFEKHLNAYLGQN